MIFMPADSKPLMQKEYPKLHRRSDDEEKQVIDKIKASLRRLNSSNISSLGMYIFHIFFFLKKNRS